MNNFYTCKNNIHFHADDFGYNVEVSKDILDCYHNGTLNGISIMPNSPYFTECMEFLNDDMKLEKSIHFSLSEGPCVSDKSNLSYLVDERGMFKLSFFKLLLMSFGIGAKRTELKKQVKTEIKAQYDKALPYLVEINVDSHVHYHMIPVVLESIIEVIGEDGKTINYIRVPSEPIVPFLKNIKFYKSYKIINFIKNIVLNFLGIVNKKMLKPYSEKTAVFFGISLSGEMDVERVSTLIPSFMKKAKYKKLPLEVLAHPGQALGEDTVLDPQNDEYMKAPLSENRRLEKRMFMEIHNYL